MDVYVFSQDLNPLGLVNNLTGITWTDRYSSAGEFELWCPITDENLSLLSEGHLIWMGEETIGVIQFKELSTDSEGSMTIHVQGQTAECYLDQRVMYPTVSTSGSISSIMRVFVSKNVISPMDSDRIIPNVRLAENQESLGDNIKIQKTGGSVLEALSELGTAYLTGFKLVFDPINKALVFTVVKGKNRSIDQDVNDPVVFSSELDDILESKYTYNESSYRNIAYVLGEGEGADRVLDVVGSASGLARRELYVDARDLQREVSWNCKTTVTTSVIRGDIGLVLIVTTKELTNPDTGEKMIEETRKLDLQENPVAGTETIEGTEEIPMPEEDYKELLKTRGREELEEYQKVDSFDASFRTWDQSGNVFRRDYDLGDIVTVFDSRLKIRTEAIVTEATTTYDDRGKSLDITFGYSQPTISQLLKRRNG